MLANLLLLFRSDTFHSRTVSRNSVPSRIDRLLTFTPLPSVHPPYLPPFTEFHSRRSNRGFLRYRSHHVVQFIQLRGPAGPIDPWIDLAQSPFVSSPLLHTFVTVFNRTFRPPRARDRRALFAYFASSRSTRSSATTSLMCR